MTREFTFVEYDFDRNGITEHAKAHLSRERHRTRTEAQRFWFYLRVPIQLEPKVSEAGSNYDAQREMSQDAATRDHLALGFGSNPNRRALPSGKRWEISLPEHGDLEIFRKDNAIAVTSTPNLPLPDSHGISAKQILTINLRKA